MTTNPVVLWLVFYSSQMQSRLLLTVANIQIAWSVMVIRFEGGSFFIWSQVRQIRIIFLSIIFTREALAFNCKEVIFLADCVQVLVSLVRWVVLHTEQRRPPAQVPGCSALKGKFTWQRKRKEKEIVCKGSTTNAKFWCLTAAKQWIAKQKYQIIFET